MDAPGSGGEFSRSATFEDLIKLCRYLNGEQAKDQVEIAEIQGVRIPFLKPELLIQTKDTLRPLTWPTALIYKNLLIAGMNSKSRKAVVAFVSVSNTVSRDY